jgi:hypothetical protein
MEWYADGNALALVEAMQKQARKEDGGFRGEAHTRLHSGLIGTARSIGVSEEDIRDAFESDRGLTIYEP